MYIQRTRIVKAKRRQPQLLRGNRPQSGAAVQASTEALPAMVGCITIDHAQISE
jgi:hypothetical protein